MYWQYNMQLMRSIKQIDVNELIIYKQLRIKTHLTATMVLSKWRAVHQW